MDLNKLHDLLVLIDQSYEYVNYGGCAVVAATLAQELRHIYPIMRITGCDYDELCKDRSNIDTVRKRVYDDHSLNAWSCEGLSFSHMWIEVLVNGRWHAIDVEGVMPIKHMYRCWAESWHGSFTHQEVTALSESTHWNSRFDRDQIDELKFDLKLAVQISQH